MRHRTKTQDCRHSQAQQATLRKRRFSNETVKKSGQVMRSTTTIGCLATRPHPFRQLRLSLRHSHNLERKISHQLSTTGPGLAVALVEVQQEEARHQQENNSKEDKVPQQPLIPRKALSYRPSLHEVCYNSNDRASKPQQVRQTKFLLEKNCVKRPPIYSINQ